MITNNKLLPERPVFPGRIEQTDDLGARPAPDEPDETENRCNAVLQKLQDLIDDLLHVRAGGCRLQLVAQRPRSTHTLTVIPEVYARAFAPRAAARRSRRLRGSTSASAGPRGSMTHSREVNVPEPQSVDAIARSRSPTTERLPRYRRRDDFRVLDEVRRRFHPRRIEIMSFGNSTFFDASYSWAWRGLRTRSTARRLSPDRAQAESSRSGMSSMCGPSQLP